MSHVVGAYPAAPPADPWDPAAEQEFLAAVGDIAGVTGFELPYLGAPGLHGQDEGWLLDHLPDHGVHVVTAVPATAMAARTDRSFGLASTDADGRRRAIDLAAGLREAVERVVQHAGRKAVVAVELHSAPSGSTQGPAGSGARFADSLAELSEWDWCGARLVVEHCDAAIGPHRPEKGFLPLALEIEAVRRANDRSGANVGLAFNWARSVIEGRDVHTPVDQIREIAAAGLLAGVVFSGVASSAEHPAGAWADAHLPPRPMEPLSLLDESEMVATLAAAGSALSAVDFSGVKLGARRGDVTPLDRAEGLRLAVEMLDRAWPGSAVPR